MNEASSQRIPNLLHLFLFFVLAIFAALFFQVLLMAVTYRHHLPPITEGEILQFGTYILTLIVAVFVFPPLWHRPFFTGIRWNAAALRPLLVLAGLVLGFAMQGVEAILPQPKDLPVDALFRYHATIWLLAFFGVVVGPLFEEVVFRGFLLPALAHGIDWLRIPRDSDPTHDLAGLEDWRISATNSHPALILSTIVTSILFALLHAPQIGWTWTAIAALFVVSLVLCFIRIRTGSLAASFLVHGCYNLSIFVTLFFATGGFHHLERI